MSTKKIRAALGMVDTDHPNMTDEQRETVAQALAEVEAIAQTAKDLQFGPPGTLNDRAIDAWLDMGEAIAKETT